VGGGGRSTTPVVGAKVLLGDCTHGVFANVGSSVTGDRLGGYVVGGRVIRIVGDRVASECVTGVFENVGSSVTGDRLGESVGGSVRSPGLVGDRVTFFPASTAARRRAK